MAGLQRGSGKERLLAAALQQFTSEGFEGASIRAIGGAAGLTNPALYRHFAGKHALGAELYRRCYGRMVAVVERATQPHKKPLDKIAAYVSAIVDLIESDPATVGYIDENQVRFWPALRKSFEPRSLSTMVSGWIEAGRRDGSIDARCQPSVQVALTMGVLSQWAAMRAAGLASAAHGAGLSNAVRRALVRGADGGSKR